MFYALLRNFTYITQYYAWLRMITLVTQVLHSDRHEPVLSVVAFVPTFLDRGTILSALPSESVTTPGHVPILK